MKSIREQIENQLKLLAQFLLVAATIGGGVFTSLSRADVNLLLNIIVSLLSVGVMLLFIVTYALAKQQEIIREVKENNISDEVTDNENEY